MRFRPIQINDVVLPEFAKLEGEAQIAPSDQELAFGDGSQPFETKSRIGSRNCSIICSYFDKYGKSKQVLDDIRNLFHDKLQSLFRRNTILYAIGQDNLIYKLRVTVGLGQFAGEEFENGFDFMLALKGFDPYFEECTNKMYFAPLAELSTIRYPKYDNSLSYSSGVPKLVLIDGTSVNVGLIEFEAPNCWNPDDQYIAKQFWNTSTSTAAISGTGTTSFDTNDTVSSNSSFVITTSNILRDNTATFSVSQNILTHGDASAVTALDLLEFKIKVSVLNNLDILDIQLQTNTSNHLKINVLERISFIDNNGWATIRLYLHEFTQTGLFNFASLASLKIDHRNTGSAATIKFNDFRIVKNFGLNMDPITVFGTDIFDPSQSSRIEAWFCFEGTATVRQVAIGSQIIQTTKRLILIKENGWAEGDTPLTMAEKQYLPTHFKDSQISIFYNSDQAVSAYYSLFKTKL